MRYVWRLVRLALAAIVVLALVGGILLGVITWRALPQTGGTLQIKGLDGEVTVIRDAAGIARIYADSPHDLFMAQGYVHAQDRLWQMEVWRHISAGRLSELFGKATLDTDKFVRTLGWRAAAQRDLDSFGPPVRQALDAYAAGVNAYLDGHRGSLGLAFVVTGLKAGIGGLGGYDPEPWTALDSAAWQKVQSWNLAGNYDTELFRQLADDRLGDPALTDDLFPAYRADAPVITPTGLKGSGGAGAASIAPGATDTAEVASATTVAWAGRAGDAGAGAGADLSDHAAAPPAWTFSEPFASAAPLGTRLGTTADQAAAWHRLAAIGAGIGGLAGLDGSTAMAGDHGIGSNNWVIAPSLSASGGALLANDPHLGLGIPSVWYMNGLHCRTVSKACPFDVVGVSFPGVPAVILGHNARIAWGATNADPDVQDLFVETVDPADPEAYLFKGQSIPFTVRTERIAVAGLDPVVLRVRETRHGPILNDVVDDLADGPPTALRWTALTQPDGTLEALFRVNTATDFGAFREALRGYGSPSQNFVYADVDGHIGYQLPGRIPIRADGGRGVRPVSGDGSHEWQATIPFDDLPWQEDPDGGIIVSANNAAVDRDYPHFISREWDRGDRAARIGDLLREAAADGGLTPEVLRKIQLDTYVRRADRLIPRLDAAVPATADGQALLALIKGWDRSCPVDSRGCAGYLAFEFRLIGAIFDDELGPLARDYVGTGSSWDRTIDLLGHPNAAWWDDMRTSAVVETAPLVMTAALDRTASELRAALGDPAGWTWGKLHTVTLREDIYGESGIGPLEWYFNATARAAPGAAGAIDNLYYRPEAAYPDPHDPDFRPAGLSGLFAVSNGPSYRLTIDMADLESARIVQTTGQSGNPFDGHYGDLIDVWLQGDTVPLPNSPAAVRNGAAATLTLHP